MRSRKNRAAHACAFVYFVFTSQWGRCLLDLSGMGCVQSERGGKFHERNRGSAHKTPLYEKHVEHGGKIVPFAGYLLPVQYEAGVIREHNAVRENVGLFDVSHMGEVLFKGPDALSNIQHLLCNNYTTLQDGRVRYSPMLNAQGGVIDDVLVYRYSQDHYLMVVNASNRHKDVAHILAEKFGNVEITDISDSVGQLALQGPKAEAVMKTLLPETLIPQKYYSFIPDVMVGGVKVLLSRTGYTGEDGFELYARFEDMEKLFDVLLTAGKPFGLQLCGLGCRDTLRMGSRNAAVRP